MTVVHSLKVPAPGLQWLFGHRAVIGGRCVTLKSHTHTEHKLRKSRAGGGGGWNKTAREADRLRKYLVAAREQAG